MKLGRGSAEKSKPVELPERSQTRDARARRGETIPARVLESARTRCWWRSWCRSSRSATSQLEGLALEFVGPRGRVRLTGTVSIEDPAEPDVLRIDSPRSIEVLQEREYVRIQSARPALVYGGPDKMPIQSYTVDLSGGGFLLAGPDSLKIGDEVEFQLTLTPGVLLISGTGKVVRVDDRGPPRGRVRRRSPSSTAAD